MIGMVFLAGVFIMFYFEITTFFQNRRDEKRIREYFKNRS